MKLRGLYEGNVAAHRAVAVASGKEPLTEEQQALVDQVQALSAQAVPVSKGSPCRPWLRLVRDEKSFEGCMAVAAKFGGFVQDSKHAFEIISAAVGDEDQEVFGALYMDTHMQIRGLAEIARGTIDSVPAPIGPTLRIANVIEAQSIAIFHTHPTLIVQPSKADKQVTAAFAEACETLDIFFADHLIIGGRKSYYSFADKGKLP